jgi:hypothetical protein
LFILCDVKHHGNNKVSFTLYFQFQKQKNNIKESQNMSKSHNVCFLNDLLKKIHSFLFFV